MCILKCILKHRILRKIRATFLSLSEEKKATSAGLKRLRRSRRPLAYSLKTKQSILLEHLLQFSGTFYITVISEDVVYMPSEAERNEYVLNEFGRIWIGSKRNHYGRPWFFGQVHYFLSVFK